jgi:very-short-patch-repair endonuclease
MREDENLKFAKTLRKNATLPEAKLWAGLRNRQVGGFKFRRQAPIGIYIVDLVCLEKNLVIELDGWTHSTPEELAYDARRTEFLGTQGFRVIRFGNGAVMENTDGVLQAILKEIEK